MTTVHHKLAYQNIGNNKFNNSVVYIVMGFITVERGLFMSAMPLISIIVPVYNVEKYLRRCVNSILKQSYANIEVILVDDGSIDQSGFICDSYKEIDSRVVVIHKENGGLSSARNAGLDKSTGDYIGFIDSDDWIATSMYSDLLNALSSNDNISTTLSSRYTENDDFINQDSYWEEQEIKMKEFFGKVLVSNADCSVCTKLFPREIIGDTRFKYNVLNEDFLFLMEITNRVDKITCTQSINYCWMRRRGSISNEFGRNFLDAAHNSDLLYDWALKNMSDEMEKAAYYRCDKKLNYIIWSPNSYKKLSNKDYTDFLYSLRKEFYHVLGNRYFSLKRKAVLTLTCIFPKMTSTIFRKYVNMKER